MSSTDITASSRPPSTFLVLPRMPLALNSSWKALERLLQSTLTLCSLASRTKPEMALEAEASTPSKPLQSKTIILKRLYLGTFRSSSDSIIPSTCETSDWAEAKKMKPLRRTTRSQLSVTWRMFRRIRGPRRSTIFKSAPRIGLPSIVGTFAYFTMKEMPQMRMPVITAMRSWPVMMKTARMMSTSTHSMTCKYRLEPHKFSQTKPAPAKNSKLPTKNLGM
mmetsp:Transcript_127119/g.395641  ORF Transcript_127119/g.395641 Transcript_127119/m.395641 type:complete len:221 (+) Transcript_127119:96-758(+)